MSKIRNPINFSSTFSLNPIRMQKSGVIDIVINADTNLFIDPLLLLHSRHREMSHNATLSYRNHFLKAIKLLKVAKAKNDTDIAWRNAKKLFQFHEISWTCLGYGGSVGGSGFGYELISTTLNTAKEIVDLGVEDVDLFMALALFEEGIGPDRISDMTTNIILLDLISFNQRVISELGIKTEKFMINGIQYDLARNPYAKKRTPILLVPDDIVRDLPIAADWSDISHAARYNEELRERVNTQVGEIWATMNKQDKSRVKASVLRDKESFDTFLELLKYASTSSYDIDADLNGELFWSQLIPNIAKNFPYDLSKFQGVTLTIDNVYIIVGKIIEQFEFLIERRDLWRELWDEKYIKNRKEKAAQRLFFAVADSYCKANNLDLTPEADTGNGPVDFKISSGGGNKVLVEIKLSTNPNVVHGYEKQLEIYKDAENTHKAYYLLIDVGNMGKKDEQIMNIQKAYISNGLAASTISIIDGMPRESASKRL